MGRDSGDRKVVLRVPVVWRLLYLSAPAIAAVAAYWGWGNSEERGGGHPAAILLGFAAVIAVVDSARLAVGFQLPTARRGGVRGFGLGWVPSGYRWVDVDAVDVFRWPGADLVRVKLSERSNRR